MKSNRLVSALIFMFVLVLPAYAQDQATTPSLADFSKWQVKDSELGVTFDGNPVVLKLNGYSNLEDLRHQYVSLLYNQNNNPWLAIYREYITERNSDDVIHLKDTNVYFFENVAGKWVLVKDLSDSPDVDQEILRLSKEKYGFEVG